MSANRYALLGLSALVPTTCRLSDFEQRGPMSLQHALVSRRSDCPKTAIGARFGQQV